MVYGGTIRPGSCEGAPQLDIVSAFQSYGKYLQDGQTESAELERSRTIRNCCPGPGACGGVSTLLHTHPTPSHPTPSHPTSPLPSLPHLQSCELLIMVLTGSSDVHREHDRERR